MPNGCRIVPFSVANVASPSVSSTTPLECRLSPRQPGYVRTVCAWIVRKKVVTASRHIESEKVLGILVFGGHGRRAVAQKFLLGTGEQLLIQMVAVRQVRRP